MYGFNKAEKLTNKSLIENLFVKGKSVRIFPFTIYYRIESGDSIPTSQVLISVSKHYFKHAVKRNRIKRLTREAFRLNNHDFKEFFKESSLNYNIGFVYHTSKLCSYKTVEKSIIEALNAIKAIVGQNSDNISE